MSMSPRRIKIVSAVILAAALGVWYCVVRIQGELGDEGTGDWRYALELLKMRTILAFQQRALGRAHETPLLAQQNLAGSLYLHGKNTKAEKECRALITRQQAFGPTHSQTFQLQRFLIQVLEEKGEIAQAEKELRTLIAAREHALGEKYHDVLDDREHLATLFIKQAKHAEAELEYRAMLTTYEEAPNSGEGYLCYLLQHIALCLEAQGKLEQASDLIKRAESGFRKSRRIGLQSETPYTDDLKRIEGKVKAMGLREGAK